MILYIQMMLLFCLYPGVKNWFQVLEYSSELNTQKCGIKAALLFLVISDFSTDHWLIHICTGCIIAVTYFSQGYFNV